VDCTYLSHCLTYYRLVNAECQLSYSNSIIILHLFSLSNVSNPVDMSSSSRQEMTRNISKVGGVFIFCHIILTVMLNLKISIWWLIHIKLFCYDQCYPRCNCVHSVFNCIYDLLLTVQKGHARRVNTQYRVFYWREEEDMSTGFDFSLSNVSNPVDMSSSSRQENTLYWVLTLRPCPFCTVKSKSYIQLKTEWTQLHLG
jgi:hypothetical protein